MLPPTPRQLDAENRKPTKNGIWPYHDENGKIFEVRVRYDTADGKEVMPWHFTKDGKWVNRQAPGLRPLYRLTELRNNPEMPVVFVEGEKTADRAAVIFGDHIATTSSGGSKAHAATNYAHLKGRDVVIWPDQDKVGGHLCADLRHDR
jgi:putative DNA primase/helicase